MWVSALFSTAVFIVLAVPILAFQAYGFAWWFNIPRHAKRGAMERIMISAMRRSVLPTVVAITSIGLAQLVPAIGPLAAATSVICVAVVIGTVPIAFRQELISLDHPIAGTDSAAPIWMFINTILIIGFMLLIRVSA